jgi:histidinol dehydrogenase
MRTYELGRMTPSQKRAVMTREGVDIERAMSLAKLVVDDVRLYGDSAVRRFARKFDSFGGMPLTVPPARLKAARGRVPRELIRSMKVSKRRIEAFHRRQRLEPFSYRDECGEFGQRIVPLERVGVYVPGGTADYVSSVFMCCIPARIAGVDEIALCTPGKKGRVPDTILAAAEMCGVEEVHPVGGPQAIGALAYGTESIPRVQKIVGPGGAYVAAAKLMVRNDCEIDFLAGPSEVLVISDGSGDPEMIASDMVAQLEHDPYARSVLVTTSETFLEQVRAELRRMLKSSERKDIASEASVKGAVFVLVESLDEAIGFSNEFAPEHLLIDVKRPARLLSSVRSAGSVFLGGYSSVAFGDYCSGTNHVLPTKGTASMKSSLSVYDFLKIIPYQSISREGVSRLAGVVDSIASAEGLPAHAAAAKLRARKVGR